MTRKADRTHPVEDDTLGGLVPPAKGTELDAERRAEVTMLRSALSDLTDGDRKILLDRHVHDKAVTTIATGLGVRPHAAAMRVRRAEERLAGAFAAAHARSANEPECRTTRAVMHDYLKGRLLPGRQRHLELHMDACTECTRAFIDVREVSWMLRDLGQHLIGGVLVTRGAAGTTGAANPRSFVKQETVVAAGMLAALAIGAGAAAYLTHRPDQPPVQATEDGGASRADGSSGGGTDSAPSSEKRAEGKPASIPPADPHPRPATTPKEDAATAPADQPPAIADPVPAPVTEAESDEATEPPATGSGPDTAPRPRPNDGSDEPAEPADPPTEPAPENPADPQAGAAAAPTEPTPELDTPPESSPPGNNGNGNGPGHGQGPGNNNGQELGDNTSRDPDLRDQLTRLFADLGLVGAPSR